METSPAPFLKLIRGPVAEQLLRHPKVFALLTLAALRARRTGELRLDDLTVGEAMMGDYEACGNTRQEFRTNLDRLKGWGLVTTRSTNRGTVVKVLNTEVYDTNSVVINHPTNHPATSQQPTDNQLATTNKNLLLEIEQLKEVLKKQEEEYKQRISAAGAAWREDQKKIGELEGQVSQLATDLEAANARLRTPGGAARPKREAKPKAPPAPLDPAAYSLPDWAGIHFTQGFARWLAYRQGRTDCKKLTTASVQEYLNELAGYNEEFALGLFSDSIKNGWQGLTFKNTALDFANYLKAKPENQQHGNVTHHYQQHGTSRQPQPNGRFNVEEAVGLARNIAVGMDNAQRAEAVAGCHDAGPASYSTARPPALSYPGS